MKLFKRIRTNHSILLILPAMIFTLMFAGYGMFYAFVHSVEAQGVPIYLSLFQNQQFLTGFFFSLKIAVVTTLSSLLIGFLLALLLYSYLKISTWKLLVWLPMLVPHFVAAYIFLLFFSQTGLISSLLFYLGLITEINQFPIVVFDENGIGITLSYIWKSVPFVVLMLLPAFYKIDRAYVNVVRTFGGGRWEVFKMIEWPWLVPVVIETGLILFAFIISAFEVPYLLGVTEPKMVAVLAHQWFYEGDWSNRSLAVASLIVLTSVIFLVAFLSFRVTQRKRFVLMRGRQG